MTMKRLSKTIGVADMMRNVAIAEENAKGTMASHLSSKLGRRRASAASHPLGQVPPLAKCWLSFSPVSLVVFESATMATTGFFPLGLLET